MKRNLRDVSDRLTELENDPVKVNIARRNTDQSDTKSKARGFSNIHYRMDSENDVIHIGHRPYFRWKNYTVFCILNAAELPLDIQTRKV